MFLPVFGRRQSLTTQYLTMTLSLTGTIMSYVIYSLRSVHNYCKSQVDQVHRFILLWTPKKIDSWYSSSLVEWPLLSWEWVSGLIFLCVFTFIIRSSKTLTASSGDLCCRSCNRSHWLSCRSQPRVDPGRRNRRGLDDWERHDTAESWLQWCKVTLIGTIYLNKFQGEMDN